MKKEYKLINYLITDYDGDTKVATIEKTDGELINSDWIYTIYDIANGMNYFTIDGTNLNIDELSFDFQFLYL